MSIKIACKCGRAYWVPDDKAGKRLGCKACGARITVPASAAAPVEQLVSTETTARPRPRRQPLVEKPAAGVPRRLPDEIRNKAIAAGHALASNPCCSKLDFFQYFLCRPIAVLQVVNITLFGLALSIALGNPIPVIFAFIGGVIFAYRKTRLVRKVILSGNVNPAIIIGKNPWRVAVYGDLSTGFDGPRPAVKVMMAPLRWMAGGPPEIGKRVSAPSTYMKGPDPCAWTSFFPFIFETMVRDPEEVKAVMNSLDQSEWPPLEAWIRRNPNPGYGLYRMWPGAENVIVKPSHKQRNLTIMWSVHAMLAIAAATKFASMKTAPPAEDAPAISPLILQQHVTPPEQISPPTPVVTPPPQMFPSTTTGDNPDATKSQEDPFAAMRKLQADATAKLQQAADEQKKIQERIKQGLPPGR